MPPMRLYLIVFLAACSSGSSGSADDVETISLTCSGDIAAYCATNPCDRDLAAAKQDRSLCPAFLIRCGDCDVILRRSGDTATNYYYQDGLLAAVEHIQFPSRHTCLGGPVMFDAPQCATTNRPLPACSSSTRGLPPSGASWSHVEREHDHAPGLPALR